MTLLYDPEKFWLIMTRLSGFFLAVPGLSDIGVPTVARAGLSLWLAVLLIPLAPDPVSLPSLTGATALPDMAFRIASELVVGVGMGMIVQFILAAIRFGGVIIDSELGYLAAQQLNPSNPYSGGIFNRILLFSAVYLFWAYDYLPLLVGSLHASLRILPPGSLSTVVGDVGSLMRLGADVFSGGLTIAAPIIALMFCINITAGFLARAVQGIQFFFEVFTLKMLVGVMGFLIFMPVIFYAIRVQLEVVLPEVNRYLEGLSVAQGR